MRAPGRWHVSRRAPVLALLAAAVTIAACEERPELRTGEKRTLHSDCDTPLVCRLERCRRECARNRDCEIGSVCLFDSDGIGA